MPKKTVNSQQSTVNSREVVELTEALQRERADAMNVRRRAEEDKAKMASYFKGHIIRELLPTVDSFERALKHIPKELEANSYIKGIGGVVKQFEQTLLKLGVSRIKTLGEHFDPHLHEAVSIEEGDGGNEIVSEELQSGWQLGEEILRHAMVKVRHQK